MRVACPSPAPPRRPSAAAGRATVNRRRTAERRRRVAPTVKPVEERRTVERRRQIDPTTCERDYTGDETELMRAMDEYKRIAGRQFPTWSEVLEVVKALGYRRVAEPVALSTILEDD